jgi:ribosomal protein S18 acetylase RimI-like enzyme
MSRMTTGTTMSATTIDRTIISLRGREGEPAVAELLALAQIHREAGDAVVRGPTIAREYAALEELRLYGCAEQERIAGLIGIEPTSQQGAIIRDLAVLPETRRRGVGSSLIDHLRNDLGFASLEGDTLESAIAFYKRSGFVVREDGAMPDGQTRYRFRWTCETNP